MDRRQREVVGATILFIVICVLCSGGVFFSVLSIMRLMRPGP